MESVFWMQVMIGKLLNLLRIMSKIKQLFLSVLQQGKKVQKYEDAILI